MPEIDMEALSTRFHESGLATAQRAGLGIKNGLGVLKNQFEQEKNSAWPGQAAWIIDGLRFSASDGLDIQLSLGHLPKHRFTADLAYLNEACAQAKQSLFSVASPVGAANALSKNILPFLTMCQDISDELEKMLNKEKGEAHEDRDQDRDRALRRSMLPKEQNSERGM